MDRYIGLDAHASSCTVGVVSPSGKQLSPHVVETNGRALIEVLCRTLAQTDRHNIVLGFLSGFDGSPTDLRTQHAASIMFDMCQTQALLSRSH